jgi:hypothetical protein
MNSPDKPSFHTLYLYIESNNFGVLKFLCGTYLNRVKIINIDPREILR